MAIHLVAAVVLVACGGDDDGGGELAEGTVVTTGTSTSSEQPDDSTAAQDQTSPNTGELPADYPLPVLAGGTVLSALFDEASGSSNVTLEYAQADLDPLIETYDEFFDAIGAETDVAPLTDGLASWLNPQAGYSVLLNAQNAAIQLRLQTGV